MKPLLRTLSTPLLLSLALLVTGCSSVKTIQKDEMNLIHYDEIRDITDEEATALFSSGKPFVVHIPQGTALPVKLDVDLTIAEVTPKMATLTFKQDVYLHITGMGIMISANNSEFAPIQDVPEWKKLFGLTKGRFSIGLGYSEKDGAQMLLTLKMK